MTKKSMNKLLSVVLALAICFTTVFGCLITAGAADTNCCAKWSVGSASKDLDKATIYLAFTAVDEVAAEGFSAIEFALDGDADLSLQSIKAVATADGFASTALIDGSAVDVNDLAFEISSDKSGVIAESQNAKAYASVVLELTYGFAGGYATQGQTYAVSVSDVTLAGAFATHVCTSGAVSSTIKASCEHVITVIGDPIAVDEANNYSTYAKSVCTLCGEEFGQQLVPTADVLVDRGSTISWSAEGAYDDTLVDDADGEQLGTEASPIIINSVEELYYLAAKAGVAETANKYYKLADGISKVVFQSEANASTVIGLEDADKVEGNFASGSWFTWSGDSSKPFAGHFDGNGATFYGLYAKEAMAFGLFPYVAVADDTLNADISDRLEANNSDYANNTFDPNGSENYTANTVEVSNLNLKNSYVTINPTSQWSATAGFIFGKSVAIDGYLARYYATIEKCSIINCYMYSASDSYGVALLNGLFAGDFSACLKPTYIKTDGTSTSWYGATNGVKINNCLAYGNSLKANNSYDDTFSIAGRANLSTGGMVSNSIFLGVLPYLPPCTTDNANAQNTFSSHRGNNVLFKNIYSDVKVLEVKYSDSPKYDANSNFSSVITKITDLNSVKGSTAAATCSALDWGNTWLYDENGGYPYLASKVSNTTIYWDGTTASGIAEGSGTPEDPYIINTASELAYIAVAGYDATNDKHFKIADGIKNIVLQSYAYGADIMALEDAAAVKTYFEGLASPKNWVYKSYKDYVFAGTFDGNGATVYGLYSTDVSSARVAALFPLAEGNATIKNIALENSYLKTTSTSANYNFGGLIGSTPGLSQTSNADDAGVVWIDSCRVANNYMYAEPNNINRAGLVVGNIQNDSIIISNCLVYGNDATAKLNSTAQYDLHLIGTIQNSVTATEDFTTAHPTWVDSGYVKAMVVDSIIFDTPVYNTGAAASNAANRFQKYDCYEDVYTDMTLQATSASTAEQYATTITTISKSQAFGVDAETNLSGLAWGDAWYCGAYGELPELASLANFGTATESTAAHQLYGSSVTYNDDGTLDFNLHFVPQYAGIEATLYVGTLDASKFYKLTATESSYREDLGDTALMFTLPNISARDIDKVWLPTVVVEGDVTTEWGLTQPIALSDNAKAILAGDYDVADKQVAAALINYGMAAEEALTTAKPASELNVVYAASGQTEPDGSFMDGTHGTGTEEDPYVISTYGQLRYLAQKSTYETTHGKFFEIDENIDILCLQGKSYIGDIDKFMAKSAAEVKEYLETNTTNRWQWQSGHSTANDCFSGTLDGNGVTIVGMYTTNGGLFSVANEGACFKNITVANSYISAGWYAGAVLGSAYASETYIATIPNNTNCYGVVSFENIIVNNNYILNKGNACQQTGALLGAVTNTARDLLDKTTVAEGVPGTDGTKEYYGHIAVYASNILTYDNSIWAETVKDSGNIVSNQTLFGELATGHNGMDAGYPNGAYDNIVTIDCVPFAFESSNQAFRAPYFRNVYSGLPQPDYIPSTWYTYDQYDITFNVTELTGAAAKTAMPNLDWINTWVTTDSYPTLIDLDYVAPATGGTTIYWDGTNTAPTSTAAGTETDPIIINTAAELKYVLRHAGPTATTGKYYKIADGISTIVLQPEGVLDLDKLLDCKDGEAVEAYFNTLDTSTLKTWDGTAVFNGNIDGNGAMVVGLYDVSTNLAGLVGAFDGGEPGEKVTVDDEYNYTITSNGTYYNVNVDHVGNTIKGFTVGYSYMVSNTRLGVFGSQAFNDGYGAYVVGTWNVDTCAVINCYMQQSTRDYNSGHSGIVTGDCATDVIKLNNILVYGNKAFSAADGKDIWLRAGTRTNFNTWVTGTATETLDPSTISNSIVLGTTPYRTDWIDNNTHGPSLYSNVYTDAPTGTVTLNNGATQTFTSAQIQGVSNLAGANAQAVVDALNAANDSTVWYVGAMDDMPGFKPAGNVPSQYQAGINNVVFATADTVGADVEYNAAGNMVYGVYQTALSLKANPYMSFAFAFGNEYKENRDKIKVRFTYTQDGALTTSDEIAVPAATDADSDGKIDDIKNVNGWTNTEANGRFHTYKAECIPVEALAYGIKVEVSYDGGEWKDFGTYSVEGLGLQFDSLSKTQPGDYYATRVDAAKALLFYAQAIAARYGAQ